MLDIKNIPEIKIHFNEFISRPDTAEEIGEIKNRSLLNSVCTKVYISTHTHTWDIYNVQTNM